LAAGYSRVVGTIHHHDCEAFVMALRETRKIGTYLRNGSLWVGTFVVGDGGLDFGDDRFDAAHGLANFVYAQPTRSTNEPHPHAQASSPSSIHPSGIGNAGVREADVAVKRFKLAA
jgi:hypothetical protein